MIHYKKPQPKDQSSNLTASHIFHLTDRKWNSTSDVLLWLPSKIDTQNPFPPALVFVLDIRRGNVQKQVLKVRLFVWNINYPDLIVFGSISLLRPFNK
jgi:predicted MPP superfamily phosphohydrolase